MNKPTVLEIEETEPGMLKISIVNKGSSELAGLAAYAMVMLYQEELKNGHTDQTHEAGHA